MFRWLRAIRTAATASSTDDRKPTDVIADVVAVIGIKPLLIALGVGVVLLVVVSLLAATTVVVAAFGEVPDGTLAAIPEIPPMAAEAYMDAVAAGETELGCQLHPAVVAAIGWVESRHGAGRLDPYGDANPPIIGVPLDGDGVALIWDSDDGVHDQDTTYDRAVGPMQFLPETWAGWGQDGNGDGMRNPQNIFDAAKATVWYLCAGTDSDLTDPAALASAILRYNNSQEYLATVLAKAQEYMMVMFAGVADATDLINHPNFTASPVAIADLETGLVDIRLVSILYTLTEQQPIYVSVIKTGHYECVGGGTLQDNPDCKQSHHWHWRGADISLVAGQPVNNNNDAAHGLVAAMALLPIGNPLRPAEVGSPFDEYDPLAGFFNDQDHEDHIHLAVCGPRIDKGQLVDTCGTAGYDGELPDADVEVFGGDDLSHMVSNFPEGTVFVVHGVHHGEEVHPKTNQVFIGDGAVLIGDGAEYAFTGSAANVVVSGFEVTGYDNPAQRGAINAEGASWMIENNYVHDNAGAGIRAAAGSPVIRNNTVTYNHQLGVTVLYTTGGLVADNEIAYNNWLAEYDWGWEAGGSKFWSNVDLTLDGNWVHDNHGPGLWSDTNNLGTVYKNNTVENNYANGIFHEVSYDAVIRNNTVRNNGFGHDAWLWGAGILIAASPNVEVYGNTVDGNYNGITLVQQDREDTYGEQDHGPYIIHDTYIHDNTIINSGLTGAASDTGDNSIYTDNNRFEDNHYQGDVAWHWDSHRIGWDSWQSVGNDTGGSYS